MFKHIMMPVDLGHLDDLERALSVGADLARHYGARLTYVGVTAAAPGKIAHNPQEYGEKLAKLAEAQAAQHGHETGSHVVVSHDPAAELDTALIGAVGETGCDLIVMATHLPRMADMILPAHGGELARHSAVSVMLVRGT